MNGTIEERVDIIEKWLGITEDTIPGGDMPTLRYSLSRLMEDHYKLFVRVCKIERDHAMSCEEPTTNESITFGSIPDEGQDIIKSMREMVEHVHSMRADNDYKGCEPLGTKPRPQDTIFCAFCKELVFGLEEEPYRVFCCGGYKYPLCRDCYDVVSKAIATTYNEGLEQSIEETRLKALESWRERVVFGFQPQALEDKPLDIMTIWQLLTYASQTQTINGVNYETIYREQVMTEINRRIEHAKHQGYLEGADKQRTLDKEKAE